MNILCIKNINHMIPGNLYIVPEIEEHTTPIYEAEGRFKNQLQFGLIANTTVLYVCKNKYDFDGNQWFYNYIFFDLIKKRKFTFSYSALITAIKRNQIYEHI